MISPETHGKFAKGALDLRLQGSKQYQMDFSGSSTNVPLNDDSVNYGFNASGELGILRRLDFFILSSFMMSPTLFGAKLQFSGDPRVDAKKGNFSAALSVAGGSTNFGRKDNEDDTDIFDGSVDEIQVQMDHQGYRWTDELLHYVNAIYYEEEEEEEARGKVTNNTATLVDAPFKFNNSGAMYSTGFIIYAGRIHFKADFSHTTTNWTSNRENSVNILNGAIGLNWKKKMLPKDLLLPTFPDMYFRRRK